MLTLIVVTLCCRAGEINEKRRGGYKYRKLNEAQVQEMIGWVAEDQQITLEDIVDKVSAVFDMEVSTSTVSNELYRNLISYKKVKFVPDMANNDRNKQWRRSYVEQLLRYEAEGRLICFIDETNFNLFTRKAYGRSLRSTYPRVTSQTTGGNNIHICG